MPSSTRSNKEIQLLFSSDPSSLERLIRKERRSSSIDNNTSSSLDSRQPLSTQTPVSPNDICSPPLTEDTLQSTDIFHPTSIDTSVRKSIDTEPRHMVATLILVRDEKGDLHDQEGHLRNAAASSTERIGVYTCVGVAMLKKKRSGEEVSVNIRDEETSAKIEQETTP
ncbi:hypothetical protein F2Q70_00004284 [Brassica cretica]|uniref:Uncharacterized protein n=1 Tax=Brassica cretica TaxID=69181 RepID=A0A8S9G8Z7_BRACR|nr:hypothetical protein F2Q68_00021206 [Brassica cretica]KAF2571313.1 hypothetical protein F2Q70_00004284 [Brassica cretica]